MSEPGRAGSDLVLNTSDALHSIGNSCLLGCYLVALELVGSVRCLCEARGLGYGVEGILVCVSHAFVALFATGLATGLILMTIKAGIVRFVFAHGISLFLKYLLTLVSELLANLEDRSLCSRLLASGRERVRWAATLVGQAVGRRLGLDS